jgi:plastocyanin
MTARHRCARVVAAVVAGLGLSWPAGGAMVTAQGATGRVSGTVNLTVAGGQPSGATVYGGRSIGPRAKAQPELRNVLVFIDGGPAAAGLKAMRTTIAQKDEQFVPHVTAVTAGSTVDFPNEDAFFHNVFSLSRPATFDLGRYPSGASRSRTLARPGIVKVYCQIHSHMSAVVRVFDHPWFTIPDTAGAFAIDGIPPGQHTLVAWHERIGERSDRISVRAGATTEITFTLPVLEASP